MLLSDAALNHLAEVASEPDLTGTRYELGPRIGQGGMGAVYVARDQTLGREVALKVCTARGPDLAERLAREAKTIARLEHPGVVPVHDAGLLPDGRVYYVMKLVRGERLDLWARGKDLRARLRLFQRVCEAVAFAHAHDVLHRDLKPENVMVGEFGEALVMDWGLAKELPAQRPPAEPTVASSAGALVASSAEDALSPALTAGGAHLSPVPGDEGTSDTLPAKEGLRTPTQSPRPGATPGFGDPALATLPGAVVGTPAYMAPEQARGAAVTKQADIYGLGAMLYALLAEQAPGPKPAPLPASVPRPVASICRKAMAAEPGDRYESAEDLGEDVGHFLDQQRVLAHPESMLERAARFAARNKVILLFAVGYLLLRLLVFLYPER